MRFVKFTVALAAAALVLTACTPAAEDSSEGGAFDWPEDGEPGGAGNLIIAGPGTELATIEPGEAGAAGHAAGVLRNVIQSLLTRDTETNEIAPLLATEWTAVDDLHWEFTLRDDVAWHDGTEFNAETAAAALTYMWNSEFPYSGNFVGGGATFSAVDDYTLEIALEEPDSLLPARMTMIPLPSPTQIAEAPETLTTNLIGTGPYKFVSWTPGSELDLELNADYFDAKPGMYDTVNWLFREESQVRAQLVQTGEANLALDTTPEQCAGAVTDTSECIEYTTTGFRFIRPDYHNQTVLSDPRIRQALAYAVDRAGISSAFISPSSSVADNPGPVGMVGFAEDVKTYEFDPDKAKELVEEAAADGVNVDLPLTIKYRTDFFPGIDDIAQTVVTNLNAVGLNAVVQAMPDAEGLAEYRQGVEPNSLDTIPEDRGWVWIATTSNDLFDFFQPGDTLLSCGGRFSVYCNEDFQEQYEAALPLVGQERQDAFADLWTEFYESEVPILPIGYAVNQLVASTDTQITPRADGFLPLHETIGAQPTTTE